MDSRSASPRTAVATPQDGIYRRRWLILGVLITSLMAIVLDNTVLNVALKTIAEPGVGLGASQSQLEWGINSYTLVFAGLLFTFGVVGDRIGRKRMLMIGLVAFGLFSLITAYAQTPDQLVWARAAMGLGAAAVMPQTLSIITNVFDPRERPRAIGIWAMAVGIGVAIGPVVGGPLSLVFFGMMGALFFLSFYLQSVRGYSALQAGLLSLPFAAGQMLLAPRSASLVRRFGTKAVVASGLLVVTLALAGYQMLGTA